jgi:hypothetical protein
MDNRDSNVEAAFAYAREMFDTYGFMLWPDLVTVDSADAELRNGARLAIALLPDHVLSKRYKRFVCDLLSEYKVIPRKRGNKSTTSRDLLVTEAVKQMTAFGFKPTRNPGHHHRRESASSIVAKVLKERGIKLTERRVGDIWAKYRNRTHDDLPTFDLPASALRDDMPWEAVDQMEAAVRDKVVRDK